MGKVTCPVCGNKEVEEDNEVSDNVLFGFNADCQVCKLWSMESWCGTTHEEYGFVPFEWSPFFPHFAPYHKGLTDQEKKEIDESKVLQQQMKEAKEEAIRLYREHGLQMKAFVMMMESEGNQDSAWLIMDDWFQDHMGEYPRQHNAVKAHVYLIKERRKEADAR